MYDIHSNRSESPEAVTCSGKEEVEIPDRTDGTQLTTPNTIGIF